MSKSIYFTVFSAASLLLGGIIYILFRENTYIAGVFDYSWLEPVRNCISVLSCDFIKYYLPDFLWSLSLCGFLIAIFAPKLVGAIICGATAVLCGTLWEFLQCLGICSGTGDVFDIVMYLAAACVAVIISIKGKFK